MRLPECRFIYRAHNRPGPISEVAHALAGIVSSLPDEAVEDLRRMLGHELADQPMPERRHLRLGLLMKLALSGTGEFIHVEDYEAARNARARQGEDWPASSTLSDAYGTWTKAVAAAMAVAFAGANMQRPSINNNHRHGNKPRFTMREVLETITRAHTALGDWPYEEEFYDWGRITRELANLAGNPDPRIPTRDAIERRFGTYNAALQVAIRLTDERRGP